MTIRKAKCDDARAICSLINRYAEQGLMLHRSLESIYGSIREFLVAEDDSGELLGCVACDVFWRDLAEVKSLAVAPAARGRGVGSALVGEALEDARRLGVGRLFALTYERAFFERLGFEVVDRQKLPEKVWRECISCPKADQCDEIAMWLPAAAEVGSPARQGQPVEESRD